MDEIETLEDAVGQMLIVGFDGDGREPPAEIRRALEAGEIGGVVLFSRNVRDLDQVVALNEAIHAAGEAAKLPPFVAVDQEGGPVMRIREGVTPIPPMGEVGAHRDPRYVARVSEVIATELQALGFNLNFAPVLDVDTNPDSPIIGQRAFGSEPERVGRAGGAYLFGHTMAGVVPCGKHFPGHGDTEADSHEQLPVVQHGRERLDAVELAPFLRMVEADIPMLMTAHLLLPALDAVRPATFSPTILDGILRDEFGYEGVVISDDLEMSAVADRYDVETMVELGLEASLDIFLICHTSQMWKEARRCLLEAGRRDDDVRRRILESGRRVAELKSSFLGRRSHPWEAGADWKETVGSDEHLSMVDLDD